MFSLIFGTLYYGSWTGDGRKEGGGGGGRGKGGLSPLFNSSLIRVLAAKHLPCSSPTPIHITPVLLHP